MAIFFIMFFGNLALAQSDTSYVVEMKSYVKYLDSINHLTDVGAMNLSSSIADGIVKRDGEAIGGFGVYTLSNDKHDTVFRIEYHSNVDVNLYKTYYFKSNKLVFALLELKDTKNNLKALFRKEELYNGDQLVWTAIQKEKKANRYYDKTQISLYQDGLRFLKDFKNDSNSR